MSVPEWSHRILTLEDWAALPETPEHHIEVVEGVPVVLARPIPIHQRAANRLTYWLDEQMSKKYSALQEIDMVVVETPFTLRAPDIVVVETVLVDPDMKRCHAHDVRLAVEVLSENTKRTDRFAKFSEYAEAGIDYYWIVDLDPPVSLHAYRLVNGDYEDFGEQSGTAELDFDGTLITLDLNALVER